MPREPGGMCRTTTIAGENDVGSGDVNRCRTSTAPAEPPTTTSAGRRAVICSAVSATITRMLAVGGDASKKFGDLREQRARNLSDSARILATELAMSPIEHVQTPQPKHQQNRRTVE